MDRLLPHWMAGLGAASAAALALAAPAAGPAAPVAGPTPAQLAALAFPGWGDHPAGRVETVTLPRLPGASRNAGGGWRRGANRVLVDPKLVLRVDATHLTLVAGLVPSHEGSVPTVSHVTPMALAAYQFEQRNGAWRLAGSQGVFALRGFFGEANLRVVPLGGQRQAVAVEYGSCWQGYCGTWLAMYELDKGRMREEPALETALSGVNISSAGDCTRRLQPLIRTRPQDAVEDGTLAPESHDCYAIESSWAVDLMREQPGDFTIRFQGAISRADAHAAPPNAIEQRQVLRYYGGKYRAISGFNPVPPI